MKAIKRKTLYPVLKLYSPNKQLIAILSSKTIKLAYDIVKTSTLNDVSTLNFKIPFDNTVISHNSSELLVKLENDFYIIKTVQLNDQDSRVLDITCESEFVELKGIKCLALTLTNASGKTPEELFNLIMSSPMNVPLTGLYKWGGTDIVDTYRFIEADNGVSVFENLLTLCQKFDSWMEFSTDSNGQKWIFLRKNAINNGKFLRKGQGLKSLDITYDSTGIFTRLHAYGKEDPITNNPINITSVNPTGKLYVENVSWFISKGMTLDEIHSTPRCVQETDYTNSDITDVQALYDTAIEELKKVAIPVLSGKVGISDFSIYEDTSITEPVIGEQILVIDQDISFNLTAQITSIERRYTENPFDVTIEISNVIKYDSVLKDLQASADIVNKVTTTTGNGSVVVNSNYVSGNINAQNTSIVGTVDNTTTSDKQSTIAILFEDRRIGYPTYGALGIGTKGLCIAKELNQDGTWDWKTFGTVNGFNASLIKTGILKSNNGDFSLNLDTGIINVPTQSLTTKDKQIANTEYVMNAIANLVNSAPSTLDTLNELATALGNDPNFATTIMNMLSLKANDTDNNRTTTSKTVTGAINELNARQNVVVGTISSSLTDTTGSIDLTITGLGENPIIVINGDYTNNTAQIVGVDNKSTDVVTVHYINGTVGNCKFNYTYSK